MYAYINIYIYSKTNNEEALNLKERSKDIGMGLEERKRRETCNSITISKNKKEKWFIIQF